MPIILGVGKPLVKNLHFASNRILYDRNKSRKWQIYDRPLLGGINKTYIERFHVLVNEKGDSFNDIWESVSEQTSVPCSICVAPNQVLGELRSTKV